MPKAEIPLGSARAVVAGNLGPATWVNVMYFDLTPTQTATETQIVEDIGYAALDLWSRLGLSYFSTEFALHNCKVFYRALDNSTVKGVTVSSAVGSGSAGPQTAQVAYMINWFTGDARKGGKPRQYLCGVVDTALADPAHLTATALTDFNAGIATWLTELGNASLPHGTVTGLAECSFVNAKVDRVTPVLFDVTSGAMNSVVATQRRRVDRLRI